METGEVQGVVGELLAVEFYDVRIPSLGKLPDDALWYLH